MTQRLTTLFACADGSTVRDGDTPACPHGASGGQVCARGEGWASCICTGPDRHATADTDGGDRGDGWTHLEEALACP